VTHRSFKVTDRNIGNTRIPGSPAPGDARSSESPSQIFNHCLELFANRSCRLSELRILDSLHRGDRIDGCDLDRAILQFLNDDVTGQIVPILSSACSALCAIVGLQAPRMR
jgi:hypothetical protein